MQQATAKPLKEYVRTVEIKRCNHATKCNKRCAHHDLHFHILAGCYLPYCNKYREGKLHDVACIVAVRLKVYHDRKKAPCEHCGEETEKIYAISQEQSWRACSNACALELVRQGVA